ncbi:uncharacterized protein N7459_009420 [Penicillium hispanicum]|uniref:uncharacterized protein n=1 Tax=Penicillium hispanicum TaxID=1080232 RepID=UPI0025417051|nr:uncharacterized protein N7459_009420 [Penicillium hispanicum]KAJ5569990.1 hypothetical protein N7459_009420 [Penicillium hispanicum]
MCGRYALGVRMAYIRQSLQSRGMRVDEAPEDDEVRETYNFAPGNFGAVYRADMPDQGRLRTGEEANEEQSAEREFVHEPAQKEAPRYRIQSMEWGLIPFWTKRQPDYGSMLRTINCRDDSLIEDRGMWTTMKRRKRCIVICQGFYEWLKKGPGGKEKVPHFVKRKDGELMCFAGLWDCVSYEGSDEKLYTYTVITTSSNPYLKFLHERMPVILDPGTEAMSTWLDPSRTTWSKDLQAILKPYEGELDCYPVAKEVGKVGNNSPDFIIPIHSKENKSNIANFFANAKKTEEMPSAAADISPKKGLDSQEVKIKEEEEERTARGVKREHTQDTSATKQEFKKQKVQQSSTTPRQKPKMRSATHNSPLKKSAVTKPPDGSQRITSFFKK